MRRRSNRFTSWLPLWAAVAAVLLVAPAVAGAQSVERKTLELSVGQQVSVSAKGVVKYSEGVGGIVDVRLPQDGGEFIVVGLNPGTSTLLLIYDDGRKVEYHFTVEPADSEVPARVNIRLDFYFVEISSTESSRVGVVWPEAIGGGSLEAVVDLPAETVDATLEVTGHALPRLDMLQSTGWAKVSRHVVVITGNGTKAKFTSGGEVNIAIQGSLAAELRRITYGSSVSVLPRFDEDSKRVEMNIDAEFSSLSGGGAVPGRSVSTLVSVVNVDMGQGVVLAGIDARAEGLSKQGLPLLSQIPVLGLLFGRRAAREEKVQSVLFIVPSVVDVVDDSARTRVDDALEIYTSYEGDIDDVRLVRPAPGSSGAAASGEAQESR